MFIHLATNNQIKCAGLKREVHSIAEYQVQMGIALMPQVKAVAVDIHSDARSLLPRRAKVI